MIAIAGGIIIAYILLFIVAPLVLAALARLPSEQSGTSYRFVIGWLAFIVLVFLAAFAADAAGI